ncbi:MAG: OmpA family protein [Fimbriimonadaceae bacterium]|nr:OmpA family protein [Fimbriimonadaceae bacterium]
MRLKPISKFIIFILILGGAYGGWKYWNGTQSKGTAGGSVDGIPGATKIEGDQGILGRPLRVGIVTWPGYAGGITANNGFKPNRQCIYWNNHKLLVEFLLMEDVDARAKAFARGGEDGVDVVWSTVDFWANELPGFIKGGVKSRAIMQVDWSRGGDAIVADNSIRRIEDLRNKKIALALFTPSHWLLEYSLQNSSLDEGDQAKIVKGLVGKVASPDARADFVAGKVDAAVVWEPDVAEALQKRSNSHILLSSKTAANLIADLMVARDDFVKEHPDVIKAFIQGWFEGTEEANRRPDTVVKLLMENEPLYKDLGEDTTRDNLSAVKWADLADNAKMFGLAGGEPLFDRLFNQAGRTWVKRGYISRAVTANVAKDDSTLRQIYAAIPKEVRPITPSEEFPTTKPPRADDKTAPLMTKQTNIFFATGRSDLDPNARQVLDGVASTIQAYSNAYIRIEGNTDSIGNSAKNVDLSKRRADAVVNYLVNRYGFDRNRLIAKGNGPFKPVADNSTNAGRAKNRRTDIQVIPR